MNLVTHISAKDLRHTWIYAAVWLAALVASYWIDVRVLGATAVERAAISSLQGPSDSIAMLALALFCGMLFLAEPVPGVRAYWLARPLRPRDLVLAKALTLGLTAVLPFAILEFAVLALRGFSLREHAVELGWNAVLLVACCAVPVAALSSVSRHLQGLLLLAIGAVAAGAGPAILRRQDSLWGQEIVAVWLTLAGGAALVCWQYRTRRTNAGRIALAALCLLVGSTAYWPESLWLSLRRAASPAVPQEAAPVAIEWDTSDWLLPGWQVYADRQTYLQQRMSMQFRGKITGLAPGWDGVPLKVWTRRLWSEQGEASEWRDEGYTTKSPFIDGNQGKRIHIDRLVELQILGPKRTYALPINQSAFLPGAGWCQTRASEVLRVECQCVVAPAGTLRAQWGKAPLFQEQDALAPRGTLPFLHPVRLFTGILGGGGTYEERAVTIETREPILYVQRQMEVRDFLLEPKRTKRN